jgi:hypothetical protein
MIDKQKKNNSSPELSVLEPNRTVSRDIAFYLFISVLFVADGFIYKKLKVCQVHPKD